jgi:alpha-galactosidase
MVKAGRLVPAAALALLAAMPVAPPAGAAADPPAMPAMGYNTWYEYHGAGDQAQVLRQARLLVSTGLTAAGYTYVNLDDGWMASARAASGALTWNASLFPNGIPWLAGQLHATGGLRLGLYEAIGDQTCSLGRCVPRRCSRTCGA